MTVPAVDVTELAGLRDRGALLIDVRRPEEYEEFHIPGAVLIPLDELVERVDEVPTSERVYVICRTGGRSAKAVEFLNGNGHDTVNVAGGSLAWVEAGHAVATGAEVG